VSFTSTAEAQGLGGQARIVIRQNGVRIPFTDRTILVTGSEACSFSTNVIFNVQVAGNFDVFVEEANTGTLRGIYEFCMIQLD